MFTLLFLMLSASATTLDSSNFTNSTTIITTFNSTTTFIQFSNGTVWTTTPTSLAALNESRTTKPPALNLSNFTECQYTTGLESRYSEMLTSHPSYVDCDFTRNHSCYALVSNFDNSLIQLGCERSIICGNEKDDRCFQHSSGYLCCCRTNNCNNYSSLHLKLQDNGIKDDFVLYEWYHFPIFVLSTFTLLCLFATILAVLFIIKNIINLSNDEEKLDKKILSKIHIQHEEVVQENRKIALANADIAVQEFYQFLERRRLVKSSKKSRSKAKFRPDYVVMDLRLRSIESLTKLVSKSSDLKMFNVKQNKDL